MWYFSTFRTPVLPNFPKLKTFQFTTVPAGSPEADNFCFPFAPPTPTHSSIWHHHLPPSPVGKMVVSGTTSPKDQQHPLGGRCVSFKVLANRTNYSCGWALPKGASVCGLLVLETCSRPPKWFWEVVKSRTRLWGGMESPRRKQKASKRKKEGEKKPEMDGRCSGLERGWGR